MLRDALAHPPLLRPALLSVRLRALLYMAINILIDYFRGIPIHLQHSRSNDYYYYYYYYYYY